MNERGVGVSAALGQYQQQVLRWNRQISLVSRQDTMPRVAALISQCRQAWSRLVEEDLAAWDRSCPSAYFDLGSGGGLPGYVWHLLAGESFTKWQSLLVEPREKRAWFLERLNRIESGMPHEVSASRWGDESWSPRRPVGQVLISLKALRLTDLEVVQGLVAAVGAENLSASGTVLISRFYPPKQQLSAELAVELAATGEAIDEAGVCFAPVRQGVVAPSGDHPLPAALVVSSYTFTH